MMKKLLLTLAVGFSCITAAHAGAIVGLNNTGKSLAAGAQDTNYVLSVAGGTTVLPGNSGFVTSDSSFPVGIWMANSADSKWLTPLQNQAASFDPSTNGVYKWHTEFSLAGSNEASASFSGRFAADNSAVAYLNGVNIGSANGFSSWSAFSATSGFHAGVNSLDFFVTNFAQNGGNPTGLRVEFLQSNVTPVPEPETYAMLLAGLGMIAGLARRRAAKGRNS